MATSNLKQAELDHGCVNVEFNVDGTKIRAELPVPLGPCSIQDLLPVLHAVTDAIVSVVEEGAAGRGTPISCRNGCGACCRQLVPISFDEAAGIRDLISDMPDERREKVRARFREARNRLQAAGLLEMLLHPERFRDDDLQPMGAEYFRLGIACPFCGRGVVLDS